MDERTIYSRRWYVLAVLVVCLLIVILDNTILNVALNTIQQDLGASQSQLEWAVNSYILVFAGLLFTWGILGDRFGRKRMLMIGMVMFGCASVLSAFSQSPGQLIATRALMGIGAAAVQPQTLSIITNVFPADERGKAIGIWAGFAGLAIAIGPVTGGLLLEHFWWGSVFLINVPVVLIGLLGVKLLVPESRDPAPGRLDPLGVLLSVVGLVALVYGIIKGGETGDWISAEVLGPIFLGVLVLVAFGIVERLSSHPALDVTLFRNPRFSAATGAIALAFFAMMGSIFFISFYLQTLRGFEPLHAGLLFGPTAVGMLLAATRSDRMVRRFGAKAVCATGLITVSAVLASYTLLGASTPAWVAALVFGFMGLGMGSVMAPATESIMSAIPREKAGVGSAVNNTVRQVAGAFGVAILGSLLAASYRSSFGNASDALPSNYRSEASESLGGALSSIGEVRQAVQEGTLSPRILDGLTGAESSAREAFLHGMHVTAFACALIALLAAAVVLRFLPGKRQTPPVRAFDREQAEPVEAMG